MKLHFVTFFSLNSLHPLHTFTALRFCFLHQNHSHLGVNVVTWSGCTETKWIPKNVGWKKWLEFWWSRLDFHQTVWNFGWIFHQNGWRVKVDWNSLLIRCIQSRMVRFFCPSWYPYVHIFLFMKQKTYCIAWLIFLHNTYVSKWFKKKRSSFSKNPWCSTKHGCFQKQYTTWKVDGATPMYWFIMAPY